MALIDKSIPPFFTANNKSITLVYPSKFQFIPIKKNVFIVADTKKITIQQGGVYARYAQVKRNI